MGCARLAGYKISSLLLTIGHGRALYRVWLHVHVHPVGHAPYHLLLILLLSKLGPDLAQHVLLLFLSHARLLLRHTHMLASAVVENGRGTYREAYLGVLDILVDLETRSLALLGIEHVPKEAEPFIQKAAIRDWRRDIRRR